MAYVPGNDTESAFRVAKNTIRNVISSFMINNSMYYIFGRTTTTVVEFRGLTRDQALAMGDDADYNYDNKHGVMFGQHFGTLTAWMRADMCEGATCRAEPRRCNEADMWRVTVTYTDTVATHSDGWSKSIY